MDPLRETYIGTHSGQPMPSDTNSGNTESTRVDNTVDDEVDESLRGHWNNKVEFFLAIMGYTVGIGSVWKFPIVCSRNGGGAFLIPFFFFLITSGGPLYYAEVCLGQFCGRSAGVAFGFCPLLKGLGFLQVSLSLVVLWYLVMVSVWIYYYLYSSFNSVLPWSTCDNEWNTPNCREMYSNITLLTNSTNSTLLNVTYVSPSFEFWENKVIGKSSGLEEMGNIQLHLVLCLIVSWTLTVLAVINGTKTLGKVTNYLYTIFLPKYWLQFLEKDIDPLSEEECRESDFCQTVVYVSATLPLIFLVILFVRGLLLDGALDGIEYYLKPNFSLLLKIKTWQEAALQVFYSLGPTWGGVITMSSYNKFHQKSYWSSILCVACAGFISFFNGLVVFTIIGFMARESGTSVEQLATQSGPGLMFVAFPIALSKMPLPQFWSVLFFIMLVTVTFDSIFGMFETVTSAVIDLFPTRLLSKRIHVNVCLGVFLTVTALPLCMNPEGGMSSETYAEGDILFHGLAIRTSHMLPYDIHFIIPNKSIDRFCNDITIMTGRKTSTFLRVTWCTVVPLFTGTSFLITLTNASTPNYGDGYVYGAGPVAAGICVGLVPVVGLVWCGVSVLIRTQGTLTERLRASINPDETWRPNDKGAYREYLMKPYTYPSSLKQRLMVDIKGV